MFAMFKQFFSMLSMLFSAGERGASALNHLGEWADETAAAFADESRNERKIKQLKQARAVKDAEAQASLPAPDVVEG